jgi:hypothetical protein
MDKYEGLDVQALNAHIAGLIHRRRQLDNQIKRLRSQRSRLVNGTVVGSNRSGTQDAKAVPTVELKPYVDEALREFTTTQLARRANVAPRTIQKIKYLESNFVTLRIADQILTACGHMDVLGRTVRIIPNPGWRREPDNDDCGT